jgi:hypothetical protein
MVNLITFSTSTFGGLIDCPNRKLYDRIRVRVKRDFIMSIFRTLPGVDFATKQPAALSAYQKSAGGLIKD